MNMEFDHYGKYESPSIILCYPGAKYIDGSITLAYGELPLLSDIELLSNYNELSELNFRSYYIYEKYNSLKYQRQDQYLMDSYASLQKYMYVYVHDTGFFRIENVTETVQDGKRTKDIHAVSCEIELKNYLVPYIEDGTYPLFGINQETGNIGILGQVMSSVRNWSIGSVDPSIASMNRSFTSVDVSKDVYSFLTDEIQEAFDCVCLFDILNRRVDVISRSMVGTETNVHLTGDDLVELIKISDPSDGPFTSFRVFGENAMSISAVNPLGSNVVYNFTNYIPWMSSGLGEKVAAWQNLVSSYEPAYYEASVQYFDYAAMADTCNAEINRLNEQKEIYQLCKDNILSTQSTAPAAQTNDKLAELGVDTLDLSDDISQVISEIDLRIADVDESIQEEVDNYNEINETMRQYRNQRAAIHDEVALDHYFTSSELNILSCYIFEKTYSDNYITLDDSASVASQIEDMDLIYHRAKNTLRTVSESSKEFSIDTEDFLFVEKFLPWIKQLVPACYIHVEISDFNVIKLFLSSICINYEDKTTRLVFSNKITKTDRRSLFDDLFRDVVTKTITYVKQDDTTYDDAVEGRYITTMSGKRITTSDGKYITAAVSSQEE